MTAEPSPDDDAIVLDRHGVLWLRAGDEWQRYGEWRLTRSWEKAVSDFGAQVYVPASRLAAVEAELAEARAAVEALCEKAVFVNAIRMPDRSIAYEKVVRVSQLRAALDGSE